MRLNFREFLVLKKKKTIANGPHGGRRVFSPLRHPYSPCFKVNRKNNFNFSFCIVRVNAPKNSQCLIWLCLLLTISSLESFVESGARDLQNDLFSYGHSRNNFVVTFEYELCCVNRKSSSIDFLKLLSTRA